MSDTPISTPEATVSRARPPRPPRRRMLATPAPDSPEPLTRGDLPDAPIEEAVVSAAEPVADVVVVPDVVPEINGHPLDGLPPEAVVNAPFVDTPLEPQEVPDVEPVAAAVAEMLVAESAAVEPVAEPEVAVAVEPVAEPEVAVEPVAEPEVAVAVEHTASEPVVEESDVVRDSAAVELAEPEVASPVPVPPEVAVEPVEVAEPHVAVAAPAVADTPPPFVAPPPPAPLALPAAAAPGASEVNHIYLPGAAPISDDSMAEFKVSRPTVQNVRVLRDAPVSPYEQQAPALPDLEEAPSPLEHIYQNARSPKRSKGLLVAAAVAVVAIGGAVFALSGGAKDDKVSAARFVPPPATISTTTAFASTTTTSSTATPSTLTTSTTAPTTTAPETAPETTAPETTVPETTVPTTAPPPTAPPPTAPPTTAAPGRIAVSTSVLTFASGVAQQSFVLSNAGDGPAIFQVSAESTGGLSTSVASGTLGPRETVTVVVSLNRAVNPTLSDWASWIKVLGSGNSAPIVVNARIYR